MKVLKFREDDGTNERYVLSNDEAYSRWNASKDVVFYEDGTTTGEIVGGSDFDTTEFSKLYRTFFSLYSYEEYTRPVIIKTFEKTNIGYKGTSKILGTNVCFTLVHIKDDLFTLNLLDDYGDIESIEIELNTYNDFDIHDFSEDYDGQRGGCELDPHANLNLNIVYKIIDEIKKSLEKA